MPIRILSVQLANQIAAGEVVERPASVVKELLENAVDSGATKIALEVEGAGRQAVIVRDNGSGIPKDELELALAPHATSKIATLDDLEAITTLGFRGEALASIAAVSKLTLISKPAAQSGAFAVHTEGAQMEAVVVPAAHPDGTSVEVRELFFNTPARRRFLRSDRTELARIKDIFQRTALSYRNINFEFYQDGKLMQSVPAADSAEIQDVGYQRRLTKLIGAQFVKEGRQVSFQAGDIAVSGLLLPPPPEYDSSPENIFLFLNGRPLADKLLLHALREAYRELSGSRTAARALLFLKCDPRVVDINVHPRKDEVRFHDARAVHDLLVDGLVKALLHPQPDAGIQSLQLQQRAVEAAAVFGGNSAASAASDRAGTIPAAADIEAFNQAAASAREHALAGLSSLTLKRMASALNSFERGQGAVVSGSENGKAATVSTAAAQQGPDQDIHAADTCALLERTAARGGSLGAAAAVATAAACQLGVRTNSQLLQSRLENAVEAALAARNGRDTTVAHVADSVGISAAAAPDSATAVNATAAGLDARFTAAENLELEKLAERKALSRQVQPPGQAVLLDQPCPGVLLVKAEGRYFLVRVQALQESVLATGIMEQLAAGNLPSHELALPFTLRCDSALIRALKLSVNALKRLGFELKLKRESVVLLAVPTQLTGSELSGLAGRALHLAAAGAKSLEQGKCPQQLATLLAQAALRQGTAVASDLNLLCARISSAGQLAQLDGANEVLIGDWARQLLGIV